MCTFVNYPLTKGDRAKNKLMKHIKNIFLFVIIFIVTACGSKQSEKVTKTYKLIGDTIIVEDESIISPRLRVGQAKDSLHQSEIFATGTVRAIPNFYAEIAPPFSGRVTKVHLKLGMKTVPGTPLFEMASPDFTEIQKSYLQAKSELSSAKANLDRQIDLFDHGVTAKRDVEEAQTHYDMQKQEYDNMASNLKLYGIEQDNFSLGQNLIVRSPIAGEVIVNDIVQGHYLREDDEPRAKIAQLNKVWVVGEVKEKDVNFISDLEEAKITLSAYPNRELTGQIFHIDEIVDESIRSVRVLIECDNSEGMLKPGMYVSVKFIDHEKSSLLVPLKSVLQFNDRSFVFVEVEKGKFMRRYIETGTSIDDKIIVTKGLDAGETIIIEGAFYLLEAK